jgi:hypothetical protein
MLFRSQHRRDFTDVFWKVKMLVNPILITLLTRRHMNTQWVNALSYLPFVVEAEAVI